MGKLNYDRTCKCDFCGKRKKVAITQYGTTNYNRLICKECTVRITENDTLNGFENSVENSTK